MVNAGVPAPEVRWFRGERREPVSIPKAKTFIESDVHTLVLPEVTELERGTYICRAINAYGHVDSIATVDVISPSAIDGGKPAMFVSRPSEKSITVTAGEDVSVSFRFSGVPKPRGKIHGEYFTTFSLKLQESICFNFR